MRLRPPRVSGAMPDQRGGTQLSFFTLLLMFDHGWRAILRRNPRALLN